MLQQLIAVQANMSRLLEGQIARNATIYDQQLIGSYYVQRTWSNVLAQGSHDPCAPAIAGAFFDSAPVLTDTVSFSSALTGTVMTKGITIAVGQLQIFSRALR